MDDFKKIFEPFKSNRVLLSCHVVFSSKLRKVIKKIGRIVMKDKRELQGFIVLSNFGLNYGELIARYSSDLKGW